MLSVLVIDLHQTFKDAMPEDVQFFTHQFDNMDKTKLEKLNNAPSTFQAEDVKDLPLEVIGAMNVRYVNNYGRM